MQFFQNASKSLSLTSLMASLIVTHLRLRDGVLEFFSRLMGIEYTFTSTGTERVLESCFV